METTYPAVKVPLREALPLELTLKLSDSIINGLLPPIADASILPNEPVEVAEALT